MYIRHKLSSDGVQYFQQNEFTLPTKFLPSSTTGAAGGSAASSGGASTTGSSAVEAVHSMDLYFFFAQDPCISLDLPWEHSAEHAHHHNNNRKLPN